LEEEGQGRRQGEEDSQNDGGDKKLFLQTALGAPAGGATLTATEGAAETALALLQQNRADQQDGQNNLRVRQKHAQGRHWRQYSRWGQKDKGHKLDSHESPAILKILDLKRTFRTSFSFCLHFKLDLIL